MYDTNYIYAPYETIPPNEKSWYKLDSVPKYDLLLIDGPDHSLRINILNHMELFDWSKPVIIDDVQEADLLTMATTIANKYCKRTCSIHGGDYKDAKQFMVIE